MLVEDSKRLPKEFPFEIQNYREKRALHRKEEKPHWHRFFEITYVEDGKAEYEVNGHIYEVETGDIILFNHIEAHRWKVLSEEIQLTVLMFSSELITDGSRMMDMDYLVPFLERGSNFKNCIPHNAKYALGCSGGSGDGASGYTEAIRQLLDEIRKEDEQPRTGNRLMIKADILKILTILVRYYEQEVWKIEFLPAKKEALRRIEKAFVFIKKNYGQKITLEEAAATVNMSPNYFSGYFKKTCGCSFQEYVTKMRMEKAREMLLHTSDGILEIAQECGVSNTANFYRLYKKCYGIAPGEERLSRKRT